MKEIRTFEKAIEEKARNLKDAGINPTLFWAYRTSKEESGNDLIDFNEVIWDYDIKEIADCLRAEGITEFTISSTFSTGDTTTDATYNDWYKAVYVPVEKTASASSASTGGK